MEAKPGAPVSAAINRIRMGFVLGVVFILWALVAPLSSYAQALPQAPDLVLPVDHAQTSGISDPPLGVPALVWQPVAGATRYQVQVSSTAGFGDPEVEETVYTTTYTPVDALADGTYYWRVRASSDGRNWGPFSDDYTFTKDWSGGGSLKPMLLEPQASSIFASFAHNYFSWQPVSGAATYVLEIGTDPTLSTIVYSATTLKPHHTPTKRLGNNTYYWRVTPVDHADHRGLSSDVWTFSFAWDIAPQLLGPDDDIETPFLPRFEWSAVEGAWRYQLEISTQSNFDSVTSYTTSNTQFTPEEALSNDEEYFWRVKAIDFEKTSSPWSEVRSFRANWQFVPTLLTPANNAIFRTAPFFSWTAIPGVERYQIQIDRTDSFDRPLADREIFNATSYAEYDWGTTRLDLDYYWRVRGIDAQDNVTPWSDKSTFRFSATVTPNPIYPPYYYTPDSENLPVHGDRTIAWPLFMWDTAHSYLFGTEDEILWDKPDFYSLTVSSDPLFQNINFAMETTGLAVAPTMENPFVHLQDGQTYYWRVRAFSGGSMMGSEEVWTTRVDRSTPQMPFSQIIAPVHPADGFEAVGDAPVLTWLPVAGAHHYRVQLSRERSFETILEEARPQFVHYVPWQSQPSPIPFGAHWWRVRAEDPQDQPVGEWSEARHFHLSLDLVVTNPYDFDPPDMPDSLLGDGGKYLPELTYVETSADVVAAPYDLGALHVTVDRTYDYNRYWAFAFGVSGGIIGGVRYGIYVDIDHVEGSGATTDPLGKQIAVKSLFLPEYVIYVERNGDAVSSASITLFEWTGAGWSPRTLAAIGGNGWYDANMQAVQVLVPYTSLGAESAKFSGSLAVAVFSTSTGTNEGMQDSVPPQSVILDNPAFVSDMLMPLYPFDTPLSNPWVEYEAPPLRWRLPYFDSVDGFHIQIARDAEFTDLVDEWQTHESKTDSYFGFLPSSFHSLIALEDNESYYWRVRIRHERYLDQLYDYGPWSQPMRFKLTSWRVGDPQVSTGDLAQTTPSFTWQRVEGAAGYTLQVDDDANFGQPVLDVDLDSTSYTPLKALADGLYYWRVATRRSSKVVGQWTAVMTFTKQSLAPTPISPVGGVVLNEQPTFSWSPVLTDTPTLRVAAPRYRLQWDDDANFGSPEAIDTQNSSYTVVTRQSLPDGTWYWRVAVIDADGNVGTYSAPQSFYKEYLPPTLLYPQQGSSGGQIYFEWEPIDGAAYYEVEIADNEGYNSPMRGETDNGRYTPDREMEWIQYYWRVRMVDDDRNPGPYETGRVAGERHVTYLPAVTR